MNAGSAFHNADLPQVQQGGSPLAYMEPKALIGASLPRGPRLSAAVHHIPVSTVNARMSFCPTGLEQGALNSRTATTIINGRKRSSMPLDRSKRTMLAAQMESDDVQTVDVEVFDPLGLSSGMSGSGDLDSAMQQKQLWISAKGGDLSGVVSAVSQGADVNFQYPDEGDATVLQCAALYGHTEIVAKLASLGANINSCDKYKWTALHDAALNGHTDTVTKLASLGAGLNARTDVEEEAPGAGLRTPLTCAAMNGHTETVRKLVSLGADLNARQKDGWTALHLAAKNGWHETVGALVELGLDVNAKNEVDMTPLHYAAWDATVETCQKLIDLGVDVRHKAKGKLSALDLAERRKRELGGRLIIQLLREAEAPPAPAAAAAGDDDEEWADEEWNPPPDEEWRALIKNNPFAKSSEGGDV
uniref:Uncharacterized protein n=1 Tax=Cryptomonas curvata TaxID=233186 RepID=A0A7S0MKM4_9CRYP